MERKGIASANVSRVNQSQILVIALTQQIRRLENKRKRWQMVMARKLDSVSVEFAIHGVVGWQCSGLWTYGATWGCCMKIWQWKCEWRNLCVCSWEDGSTVSLLSRTESCILWDVWIALIRWHQTGICGLCDSVGDREAMLWKQRCGIYQLGPRSKNGEHVTGKSKTRGKEPWATEFMGKHQKMSNIRKHSRADFKYQITWMRSVMSCRLWMVVVLELCSKGRNASIANETANVDEEKI